MVTNEGPSDGGVGENFDFIFMSHEKNASLQTENAIQHGSVEDLLALLIYYLKSRGEVGSLKSAVSVAPYIWGDSCAGENASQETETSNDGVVIEFPSVDMRNN